MTIADTSARSAPVARVWGRLRAAVTATKWLLLGAGTGFLTLLSVVMLVVTCVLCLIGIGLVLLGPALDVVRWVADLERRRLAALGRPVRSAYAPIATDWREVWRTVPTDPTVRRDLGWLLVHGTYGLVLGLLPLELISNAIEGITTPLWWHLLDPGTASTLNGFVAVETWTGAWWAAALGLLWTLLWVAVTPAVLRAQNLPGLRLLTPHPDVDLSARIAELSASRAAALDAHAVELRRIERALHDGAQNRLVTVAVLTGAARQAVARDPASAVPVLERVQESAEAALAELRSVVRSILPPVLESEGLPGALSALAAQCPVETSVDARVEPRCPMAIEAVAYFCVAEGLTNVTRHSDAQHAAVRVARDGDDLVVRVEDDGRGGAAFEGGSGLAGIRDRVRAHDGSMSLESPPGGPTVLEVVLSCA